MSTVRIFLKQSPVSVLGPHKRAVVWVQGCPFSCTGCISTHARDPSGGEEVPVNDLSRWVLGQKSVEGLTFSGGEPMMQAAALTELVALLRASRDVGVVCYTGYTLEALREQADDDQRALLGCTDLLIDGPYVEALQADLLWRGSANQRIICLTSRYRQSLLQYMQSGDRCAGLEAFVDREGRAVVAGVPPPEYARNI